MSLLINFYYHLTFILTVLSIRYFHNTQGANVSLQLPGNISCILCSYRIDLVSFDSLAPNVTSKFSSANPVTSPVVISEAYPGTQYKVNVSVDDKFVWTSYITTAPEPPRNLSVTFLRSDRGTSSPPSSELPVGTQQSLVVLSWIPPSHGKYSSFTLILTSLSESTLPKIKSISAKISSITLDDLIPGGIYHAKLMSIYMGEHSMEFTETKFTTIPNSPGNLIKWTYSETELVILLQPPSPTGIFSHYKVSVLPADSAKSDFLIEKDSTELPYVRFNSLVPGRAYTISVQTMTTDKELSIPTSATYRTIPLKPSNIFCEFFETYVLKVSWTPPKEFSEFDSYAIYVTEGTSLAFSSTVKNRNDPTECNISENLLPGHSYQIHVRTSSGGKTNQMFSQDFPTNITLKPLPIVDLKTILHQDSDEVTIVWNKNKASLQDAYKIRYTDVEMPEDSAQELTNRTEYRVSLLPGRNYSISVQAVSNGVESNATVVYQEMRPVLTVLDDSTLPSSMKLRYTSPKLFNFSLLDPENPESQVTSFETSNAGNNKEVIFSDLTPGKLYTVSVFGTSILVQHRLRPEPVTELTASNISEFSVNLDWTLPAGVFSAFEVTYLNVVNRTTRPPIIISNLQPYRNYTFSVSTISGPSFLSKSLPVSVAIQTEEFFPGPVQIFTVTRVQSRNISLHWFLPDTERNGVVTEFLLSYKLAEEDIWSTLNFKAEETQAIITNLKPGKSYLFKIQAKNNVGYGPVKVLRQKTVPLSPPKPSGELFPTEIGHSSDMIQIRYSKNYFSEENGPIIYHAIIVAENEFAKFIDTKMLSWTNVQSYKVWPPYQAREPQLCESSACYFTIGAEKCKENATGYCNGPLKSGTTYKVKIRAFTDSDQFTDTVYSFPMSTSVINEEKSYLNPDVILPRVFWTILIIVSVLLITTLFLKILFFQRKTAQINRIRHIFHRTQQDTISLETSSRPVALESFEEHLKKMSADSNINFSDEFHELKNVGKDLTFVNAQLPCNRPKNRFTDILPYDNSRYKLRPVDDEEGSDFVNANFIPGFNSPREYIATQGPLTCTRNDFWRMCWESDAPAIVMLTQCIEKFRQKCDQYWPCDSRPLVCGEITINCAGVMQYADWTLTQLVMMSGQKTRGILHFHFTAWSDFNVPNSPVSLIGFLRSLRCRVSPEQSPLIVHCSAGVGRSGTFIAIDTIMQSLERSQTKFIDIFNVVYQMRRHRVRMVQTEEQYVFIHQCVLALLQGVDVPPQGEERVPDDIFDPDEGVVDV